jgi:hypothetical protein
MWCTHTLLAKWILLLDKPDKDDHWLKAPFPQTPHSDSTVTLSSLLPGHKPCSHIVYSSVQWTKPAIELYRQDLQSADPAIGIQHNGGPDLWHQTYGRRAVYFLFEAAPNSNAEEAPMSRVKKSCHFGGAISRLLFTFLCTTLFLQPVKAGDTPLTVPSGTILPVRLNSTISSAKSNPGQVITARIMQDVPLPSGVLIRAGSKVVGHIVEVTPATASAPARVSFQFDKLVSSHQTISVTTNLRAAAGFMEILSAQTPQSGPGESDVFDWLTTIQIGGDVVYGVGGPVAAAENANQIVGKAISGGVLAQVRAKEGTNCRGPVDGNNSPQALWVFSSDACGPYGLDHVSIAHAGRTDPTGVIVLASDSGNVKIPGGTGMLLRVTNNNHS